MAITTNTYVIKDTGYYATDETGDQATDIANSGAEILIPVKSAVWQFNANIDSKAGTGYSNPSSNQLGVYKADLVSVNNPTINVNCLIDINDSTQRSHLKALEKASRTDGYKEFYYKFDNDAVYANRRYSLVEALGHIDAQEPLYPHVHVMIRQLQFPESAKGESNKIHFNMTLEIIP